MSRHGKRYLQSRSEVNSETTYEPIEAIELVKRNANAKFDETVEASIKLGIDVKHADQMVRGAVVLPHGTGKTRRVLVFAKGDKAKEAEEAGADYVGADELAAKIQEGWLDFDVAVATPDMMSVVGRLGRILGPKGMMPNPKTGTVTMEVGTAVQEIKAGKIEYRAEKAGIIHAPIGKASFETEKLLENLETLVDALVRAKPAASKGHYLRTVALSSTMGPGVKVTPSRIGARA